MTAHLPLRAVLPALALAATALVAGCGSDDAPNQADDPTTTTTPPATTTTQSSTGSPSSAQPDDPDYHTLWPAGALTDASLADGQIDVAIDASAVQRPAGMSAQEAKLAVQQVVYTMQAATQQTLPVRFLSGDAPAVTVLGVPTADPVAAADFLDVLALVSVTTPAQDAVVRGRFTAKGVASSYEGTVPWEVLDSDGRRVLHGSAQADGYLDRLYPWKVRVDVSGLAPGHYTFVAMTDDPSGGEGSGPTKDTKAITVS